MTMPYDRIATGDRIREKRILLGYTQDDMAEKINRVPKYYADIERGNCGMSIETMLALSAALNMSLDYLLLGKEHSSHNSKYSKEANAILEIIDNFTEEQQRGFLRILHIFMEIWKVPSEKDKKRNSPNLLLEPTAKTSPLNDNTPASNTIYTDTDFPFENQQNNL